MKDPFPPIDTRKKLEPINTKAFEPVVVKGNPFGPMHDYHHVKGVPPHEKRPRF